MREKISKKTCQYNKKYFILRDFCKVKQCKWNKDQTAGKDAYSGDLRSCQSFFTILHQDERTSPDDTKNDKNYPAYCTIVHLNNAGKGQE
jgi:hypothetical protein